MSQTLNPQQHQAVITVDRPLLVIAGAGSGKTRVISEKVAYLVRHGTPARHIVAVTFTNKAAREMKIRVSRMLTDSESRGLTVATFHAFGLNLVRREYKALGYKANITILDEQDKLMLLKELVRHTDEAGSLSSDGVEHYAQLIGRWKNRFLPPEAALQQASGDEIPVVALYTRYQSHMKACNAMDFDDLILLPVLLLKQDAEVRQRWQEKVRYLLVDEYQDTNQTQYELIRLLAGGLGRLTVVGDDDQSIYAWRGAQPENLVQLQQDYPRLKVIKLEQNYRSMGRILKAANQLIAHNPHVFEKRLWSAMGPGDPIRVMQHKDELAEARQVAADIVHQRFRRGGDHGEYAILYRGNHQSRLFEQALRENSIPYHISGGMSFFAYTEVKDVMAYMRLMVNHQDDAAFLRIINVPRREIGPATLEKLGQYAQRRQVSLMDACSELGLAEELPAVSVQRLQNFVQGISRAAVQAEKNDPFEVVAALLEQIDYEGWMRENASSDKSFERKQANVTELLSWLRKLSTVQEGESRSLAETLARAQLLDILDRQQEDDVGDRVSLMTLHAAKGLEFPVVYLVGMEENLLPHQNSIEQGDIEEERRLAYVGITRARRHLVMSFCTHRKRYGELVRCDPSRFLSELPEEDLEWPQKNPLPAEEKQARARDAIAQIRNLLGS